MKQFYTKEGRVRAVLPTKLRDLGYFNIGFSNKDGYTWSIGDDTGKIFWEINVAFIVAGLGVSFKSIYGREEDVTA